MSLVISMHVIEKTEGILDINIIDKKLPINARSGYVQRPVPPGHVFIRLVPCFRSHVVGAVQRAEHALHRPCSDVVAAHQVVDQLIVVAPRAHCASHLQILSRLLASTTNLPSPQLIEIMTSQLFFNIFLWPTATFNDVTLKFSLIMRNIYRK